ncbi:MAG TPA: hypothetical protein VKY32_05850 [Flavobacterium sp.]|nr:hypothetical protein [Flavobacterium sp.]
MSFKQIHIARILLTVLLFSQAGFAVNVMYCGNNVDKIVLNNVWKASTDFDDSCGHHDEEKTQKKPCCENRDEKSTDKKCCFVEVISQSGTDYLNVFGLHFDFFIWNDTYFYLNNFIEIEPETKDVLPHVSFTSNAPPLYKLYHQFIFYA